MNALGFVLVMAATPVPVLESLPVAEAPFDAGLACYSAVETDGADIEIEAIFELTKPDGSDARAALRLLAGAGGAHARASLAAVLCGHRDPASRAEAADLLGDDRDLESAFVLAIAADLEADREVRDVVLENLDRIVGQHLSAADRVRYTRIFSARRQRGVRVPSPLLL